MYGPETNRWLMLLFLGILACATTPVVGCKDGSRREPTDPAHFQTAAGTYEQLQQMRLTLTEAMSHDDLTKVHDQIYLFRQTLGLFWKRLSPAQQDALRVVVGHLRQAAAALDEHTHENQVEAARAAFQELAQGMDELETSFPATSPDGH